MDRAEGQTTSSDWFSSWMKSTTDFWLSAAEYWGAEASPGSAGSKQTPYMLPGNLGEVLQNITKMMQSMVSPLNSAEALDLFLTAAGALPEAQARVLRTTSNGYFQLQQMWLEKSGKMAEAATAFSFNGFQADSFNRLADLYNNELKPFLNVPPVGLSRFYQERASAVVDMYNEFQVALAQFVLLLHLPVGRSLQFVQEQIGEHAKNGELSTNFKEYYDLWIKNMEGHYATLYKSPEYIQVLGQTVKALDRYKGAQARLLMDMLQSLPIPTNRDMDALYSDNYEMQKKIRALTERIQVLESQAREEGFR
jgi:polyhydroxyalkanoate synthase subunit PhaE